MGRVTQLPDPNVRSLVVVTAGLSVPSSTRLLGDRLATATAESLRAASLEPMIAVVELREHAHDLTNHLLTGFPSPKLQKAIDEVLAADGLIAVSPIFNASFSGLFKVFFDVVERDALAGLPTLLAATGGTTRHTLAIEHALRPLFAYLGAATVPTGVFAAAEEWGQGAGGGEAGIVSRIARASDELAAAIGNRRRARRSNRFTDPVPFEDLLRTDPPG
jgi:FMN reductase